MARRLPVSVFLLGASLAGANLAAFGPALAQTSPTAPASPATSPAVTPSASAVTPAAPVAPASATAPAPTQSPAPPSAPTAAPTAAPSEPAASPVPAAPAGPSAETLKKARMAGYHPETKKGVTLYCQETANIGTRFPTKKCLDESQLMSVMDVHNDQADSLRQPGACTGAVCTGH